MLNQLDIVVAEKLAHLQQEKWLARRPKLRVSGTSQSSELGGPSSGVAYEDAIHRHFGKPAGPKATLIRWMSRAPEELPSPSPAPRPNRYHPGE